jgi:hypothetical protein
MTEENEVQLEQQVEQEQEVQQQPAQSMAEINWRQASQALASQKAEIEALRAELQKKASLPEEKDEFADLDPDDYVTTAKMRTMVEKLADKRAKEATKTAIEEYARSQNLQTSEERTRSKYEDYDYVVENFAVQLIKNDPALARQVMSSKNPAETAYRLGKLSDSYEEKMSQQKVSPKAEKILKNAVANTLKNQSDTVKNMSPAEVWKASQEYARRG